MNDETEEQIDPTWSAEDAVSHWSEAFAVWSEANLPETLQSAVDFVKHDVDLVHIDHLFVPPDLRGQGWGAKIMNKLVELADAHQVTLTLDPAWIGEEDEPYDLARWYGKFGFTVANMIRRPG